MNSSAGDALSALDSSSHMVSDDDDGCPSSPASSTQYVEGGDLIAEAMADGVTAQLAAAGWQKQHGDFTLLCFIYF